MVSATVDNTPVTVLLSDLETYTPATGSVQKVTVTVHGDERLQIEQGTTGQTVFSNGTQDVNSAQMVITDTETLVELGKTTGAGVYISGFEVS